jgi:Zn-dependent protease
MHLQTAVISVGAATILHEMAHVAVALAQRVKVHQVGINWRGPFIRRASGTMKQNLGITLAGPGINLWLALMFHSISPDFALCNLVFGVINLLPLPASDGSRAIKLLSNLVSLFRTASPSSPSPADALHASAPSTRT